jgi:hypothetical protein
MPANGPRFPPFPAGADLLFQPDCRPDSKASPSFPEAHRGAAMDCFPDPFPEPETKP